MTVIRRSSVASLVADLVSLGLKPGQDLLVHSSMSRIGPVDGGAGAMLRAIRVVAGPGTTVVVPIHTANNSFSSRVFLAATAELDKVGLARHQAAMEGFDATRTPSHDMGILAECLRNTSGAFRSQHPQASFAALGAGAAQCTAGHEMNCHLGEQSPLGWLYRADAAILLLGVGYEACTAFHLAEYRLPGRPPLRTYQCFTAEGGSRKECTFIDIELIDADFPALGTSIDREPFVRRGRVGSADCRLLPLRQAVDFAVRWPSFRQLRSSI
jgi:aminoglycoside 3-N-acetyltransferase